MRKLLGIVGTLVLLAVAGNQPLPAFAASQQNGMQISPLRTRVSQKPGQTTAGEISVANHTGSTLDVVLTVERFKTTDEDYHYDFAENENADWVRLADTELSLNPGESRKVAYSLAIPADAPPGGYYFAIFAGTTKTQSSTSIQEIRRVASLVYLEVAGDLVHKTSLLGFDLPWLVTTSRIKISNRLANQGNTHEDIRLTQLIKPLIGRAPEPIYKQGLLLPSTIRKLETTATMPRLPGIYEVQMTFTPPTGPPKTFYQTILYMPPWFSLTLGFGIVILIGCKISKKLCRSNYKSTN